MMPTIDPSRWTAALFACALYGALCVALLRPRARAALTGAHGAADWLVAYASQTGTAEYLAAQTVATLQLGGLNARSASIDDLDATTLRGAERVLFIVSTYGEGDAPDSASRLPALLGGADVTLDHLHYAVLALGDSSYAHYCGFGRRLDADLAARGAQPLFARIDVDRGSAEAIDGWQHHLSHLAGTSDAPDWKAPAYDHWRISERQLLNAGSEGAPVYAITLLPIDGALPAWHSGDLVQLSAPADPDYPREYSIASTHAEGALRVLVRLHLRADGSRGVASGWLCEGASADDSIALRVRQHSRFRLGENATRPLILIGNGTGIAGLRAHLKTRIDAGQTRNWLLFGERSAAHDFTWRAELEAWQRAGLALDLAFSRDGGAQRYVQHALAARADQLRTWVADGATIYVCGSLQGMAAGVHEALVAALGEAGLAALTDAGRYRRDVY